jgi:hypothetical protein
MIKKEKKSIIKKNYFGYKKPKFKRWRPVSTVKKKVYLGLIQ